MIDRLTGTIAAIEESAIVVQAAGIGLSVGVPNPGQFGQGSQATVYTYLHWNQDQGPSLYGFASPLERAVFLLIISCPGVGPKVSLSILSQTSPGAVLQALAGQDAKALSALNGIGPKKADQLISLLHRKAGSLIESGIAGDTSPAMTHLKQVSDVLSSLNYSRTEITQAMKFLHDKGNLESASFDGLMRQALSFLSKTS